MPIGFGVNGAVAAKHVSQAFEKGMSSAIRLCQNNVTVTQEERTFPNYTKSPVLTNWIVRGVQKVSNSHIYLTQLRK